MILWVTWHSMWFLPFTLSISSSSPPSSYYWVESITILKAPNPTGQPARLEEEVLTFQPSYGWATHSPQSSPFNVTPGIHLDRAVQIASLLIEKVKIPDKHWDFVDVFLEEKALVLPERTEFNEHIIDLEDGKQPPYGPIYSLNSEKLKTLKTYIETYLKTGFIWPFKSPTGAPILFNKKPDGSLCLFVDYRGLNNLKIKNRYPLPLIGELLDRLGQAKRFTQLDLTSAYHQIRIKEDNEWKTAFRIRYGHFKYLMMPFGLSNAPASF